MARPGGRDKGLFQRPSGSDVWWVRWRGVDGKYHRKKVGAKSLATAEYKRMCGRVAIEVATPKARAAATLTVAGLVERYAEHAKTNLTNWRLAACLSRQTIPSQ